MDVAIDAEQLTTYLRQKHAEHVFSIGQLLVHDFQSYRLQFKVLKFELFSVDELAALNVPIPSEFGDKARYVVVNSSTFFAYTRPNDSAVKLKNLPGGCVSLRPRSAVAAVGPDRLPPLGPRGTAWGGQGQHERADCARLQLCRARHRRLGRRVSDHLPARVRVACPADGDL